MSCDWDTQPVGWRGWTFGDSSLCSSVSKPSGGDQECCWYQADSQMGCFCHIPLWLLCFSLLLPHVVSRSYYFLSGLSVKRDFELLEAQHCSCKGSNWSLLPFLQMWLVPVNLDRTLAVSTWAVSKWCALSFLYVVREEAMERRGESFVRLLFSVRRGRSSVPFYRFPFSAMF